MSTCFKKYISALPIDMNKLALVLICLSGAAYGQKVKLLSGTLAGLKSEASFRIIFRYDSMIVGNDTPEKAYLRKKKQQWEEAEPGRGSDFVEMWFTDRKELYEPEFIKNFEENAKVKLGDLDAKYTMIVKTTRTEGGWSGGVFNHPGEIDGEVLFVEASDKSKIIARIGFYKIIGKEFYGDDFEMTKRIQAAYAVAGKGVGDLFRRKAK